MAPSSGHLDEHSGQGRDAFVAQLPKRVAAIEDVWSKLSTVDWNQDQLESLYDRVREISEFSKSLNLFQLNESVFSLEVYLSSFVGSDIRPDASQMEAIGGLVRALNTAAKVTSSSGVEPIGGQVTIFVLGEKGGLTTELGTALGKVDADVHFFSDVDVLLQQMHKHPPKVVFADTAMLAEMPPLSAEIVRMRSHMALQIPLLFISNSSSLQLRVDAIRAGGDGYFVSPLDANAIASQIGDMASPDQQHPYRVVVVEDDPTQADFAGSILRKAGMEVLLVTEPTQVIGKLREFAPDLILMDIYMPEVNGIELTTVIRDYPEFVALPIVFLSGEQNTDKQLDALSVGGDDFIAKPIRPKHLQSVVQTRIRRARQLKTATGQTAKHDRVTGLFSRQHFLDKVSRVIEQDQGHSSVAAIMAIRPDDVQRLRGELGVGGTDHLMSDFGTVLEQHIRETDLAARIGDHDFGVLLKRDSNADVEQAARELLAEIGAHAFEADLDLSASGGLCLIDARHADANGLVNRALAACEEAQKSGRGMLHVHATGEATRESAPEVVDNDFGSRVKQALLNNSFITLYQPLLDLQTRGSENYEIVLRLENSEGDLIGGRVLIDAADAAGVGEELDHWTLDRAIDILKQRRESGRRTRIFVHQSIHTALNTNMPAWLIGRLRAKQVVGTGLVIDFSLSDLSQDLKTAKANITALREMDVEVSLSRFPEKDAAFKVLNFLSAGYINIAPRLLKADRSVISAVIRQAHEANAKVIVSNIDDPRSIDLHWSSGADFLQGNFIQRPLENMEYDFSQVVI
ncbi:MAG: EAL domain-containing protein [Gammaproteobacteria bacterium]|nr:EAL domain-containing protein [Gammaproteobacteria bacterium]